MTQMRAFDKRRQVKRAAAVGVRSCFEALEERRLMSGDITAPTLVIDKPSIDGVTIVDANGPYFQFGSEDRESRLSNIQWTLTRDGSVVASANIPLTSSSYGTKIETNPYGVGNFNLTVVSTNGDGLTTTADKDLVSVDDDTTPPSVDFDYPRINPVTDAEASGIPFTWGFSADANLATGTLKVTYDPAEGGPTVTLFDGVAPVDAGKIGGHYDYFAAALAAGYSGLGTFNAFASVWDKDNDRPNDSLSGSDTHTVTVIDDDTTGPLISFFYPRNLTVCVEDPTQPFDFEILDPNTSQPGDIHIVLTRDVDGNPATTGDVQTIIDKWANGNHEAYREEIGYVQYGTGIYTLTITASNDDNDRPNDKETTTDSHSVTVVDCHPAAKPGINIVKLTNGTDNNSPTGPIVSVGSTVTWSYVVTNTGDVPLSNVSVLDDAGTPGNTADDFNATFVGGDTDADGQLDTTETWTFTASGIAVAGQYENYATVTGKDSSGKTVTDKDLDHYFGSAPAINLVKLTNGTDNNLPTGPVVPVGSTVTFTYVVTNTGNVPLSNVSVRDDNGTPGNTADDFNATFTGGDANANGLLDLTETWTYTASRIATAGQYENYGTVTGKDSTNTTVTDTDVDHHFGAAPAINLVKLTNGTDNNSPTGPIVAVGSTVTWTYVVTNTGNVPLSGVTVRDDAGTPGNTADDFNATFVGGDTDADGLLDLTETWTFTASGIAKAGQYENYATTTGTGGGSNVTDTDLDHYFGATPAINLVKLTNGTDNNSPTGPIVPVGSTVTWTYVVTNTGNLPLSGVTVRDDSGTPGVTADDFNATFVGGDSNANGLLDLTETWTFTASGIAKAGQYENYATTRGTDTAGNVVTDTDLDHYFGYSNVTIGDFVWHDLNANGLQDSGELGIAGVRLTLTGTDFQGNAVTDTRTTGATGGYLFTEKPGTYTVTVDASNFAAGGALVGYTASPTLVGANRAVDSNLSPTGTTPSALASGGSDLTLDFGYYKAAAIGDYVFSDCDGDGVQDADEIGVSGVTVKLLNGSGTVLATTTTNGSGLYAFTGLTPGVYAVQFFSPTGYRFTSPDQGADDAKDSDANVSTGKTGNYTLTSGQVNNTVDAGIWRTRSLSGYVYDDVDNDGVKDAAEDGIPGVTIRLTDSAGNPVTDADGNVVGATTTAADGSYSFGNLKPGTYRIVETQPAGWSDGKDTVGSLGGSNATNDVFSSVVIRSCGDNGVNYNFGEVGVLHGLTGTIGWWGNKNGQQQINLLGATSTSLGNWLATNFPNMYGSKAGLNNFSNKDRSYVAQRFLDLFNVQGQKLDAQVLGVCLAMFTTTKALNTSAAGQSWASQHGFKLFDQLTSAGSLYNTQWNVGTNGEAFATKNALNQLITADGQSLTVWTLLKRTDSFAVNGVLYANGATVNGVSYSSTDLRNEANVVFSAINQAGDIVN